LKGRIRYVKRLSGCCLFSTLGMFVSSSSVFQRIRSLLLRLGRRTVRQLAHAPSGHLLCLLFVRCAG
jgi:hypothetical protein